MAPSEKGGFLLGRNRHTSGAGSRAELEDEWRNRSQGPTGLGAGAAETVVGRWGDDENLQFETLVSSGPHRALDSSRL